MFLLAEYAGIVILAGLTTVLFLGGWSGPGPESIGWIWTIVKVALVSVVVIWVRVSFPRMRADQLQKLAWQGLVPVALVQLALTGIGVVVF
jgi:NADH-quinone oxidoreductase subunit H